MKAPINRARMAEPAMDTRASVGHNSGRVEVMGRDGKMLSRKRGTSSDMFAIDPAIIPEGWTYQWCRHSTINQIDHGHLVGLSENGWTPVPADRHPGYFMTTGSEGSILREGMILMERPMALTEEARREEKAKADMQYRGRREQFGEKLQPGRDSGFVKNQPTISARVESVDAPRPRHEVVVDE